ncbi:M28 family metallopeptidase [Tamlana crocina]|uniref:M28 family peptidase n=1 Tax=Tamlana crocina TaxID=393006 RepID=A0ABX1DFM3_9FLAO|nr:M28 family metallopeptidase [Tamlana crocina]NJX16282.1 M28 family peptidase [Tamlana crocina]
MKALCTLSLITLVGTCATPKYTNKIQNIKDSIILTDSALVMKYANTITSKELKTNLYQFCSNEFEGRKVGEAGQKKAAQYLKLYYQSQNIASPLGAKQYFQTVSSNFMDHKYESSENVLAFIEGSDQPDEVVIISAHLDHLGVSENGTIYPGADDDASGNVALMEMAQAFKLAKIQGHGPKRSLLFLHLTAEETGLMGSRYYVSHPVFPLSQTLANLNIDMIGRVDELQKHNENYIYLIGSDRLSKELHYLSEKVNSTYFNLNLDYRYNNENDPNKYYSRSDHYNFALKGIPVIFYFNGEHADYHKVTDTPDKINFPLLEKRTKFIFATAWQIANQEHRLVTDQNNQLLK